VKWRFDSRLEKRVLHSNLLRISDVKLKIISRMTRGRLFCAYAHPAVATDESPRTIEGKFDDWVRSIHR